MFVRFVSLVMLACVLSLLGFGARLSEANTNVASDSTGFVLVELFTSQGCSSCPPADLALRELAQSARESDLPLLPLSFHVSYWNSLGWPDPYSKDAFSQRQRAYSSSIRDGVFTPQAVLNGHLSVVASRKSQLNGRVKSLLSNSKVSEIPSFRVTEDSSNGVTVEADFAGFESGKLELIFFDRSAENEVPRGENRGRKLVHANVVLSVVDLSSDITNDFRYSASKPEGADGVALILSQRASGKTVAIAWADI